MNKEAEAFWLWFFGDGAYCEGKMLVPDDNGIYWVDRTAEKIESKCASSNG